MDPHTARAEAERWLGIAAKLLANRDLVSARTFSMRAQETDPRNPVPEQILAVIDTLLAAEKRVNNGYDWYAILQLTHLVRDPDVVAAQYRRLVLLLNPDRNRLPFADFALRLVVDAWSVLSDPAKKWLFDNEVTVFLQRHQQEQASSLPNQVDPVPATVDPTVSAVPSASQINTFQFFQQSQQVQQQPEQPQQPQQQWFLQQSQQLQERELLQQHQQQLQQPPEQLHHPQQQWFHQQPNHQVGMQQQNPLQERELLQQHQGHQHPQHRPVPSVVVSQQPQSQPQRPKPQQAFPTQPQQQRQPKPAKPPQQPIPAQQQQHRQPQGSNAQQSFPPPPAQQQQWQNLRQKQPEQIRQPQPINQPEEPQIRLHQPWQHTVEQRQVPVQPPPPPVSQLPPEERQTNVNAAGGGVDETGGGMGNNVDQVVDDGGGGGGGGGGVDGGGVQENENTNNHVRESERFWTACPYCYYMYQYAKDYLDCTLRCQNCRRAFHALQVPNPPSIRGKGKAASFCCWGYFPIGFSMTTWKRNNPNNYDNSSSSNWAPFSPMFACPVKGNRGKVVYLDDDFDSDSSGSENNDSSDDDWDKNARGGSRSYRKGKSVGAGVRSRGGRGRGGRRSNAERVNTQNQNPTSGGGGRVHNEQNSQGPSESLQNINAARENDLLNKAGASSAGVRRPVGRITRGRKKLDLNVELSNEAEEHATTARTGNRDEGIEGIAFFEGLDEFLSTLPILSVVGDGKSKAAA